MALEAVMFVGSITCEFNAQHVVDCGLVERMYTLMSDKKEDDEFVLQIAHSFGAMLRCQATRERLLRGTQVVHYLVDLLQDTNIEVRKCADNALDAVASDPHRLSKPQTLTTHPRAAPPPVGNSRYQ